MFCHCIFAWIREDLWVMDGLFHAERSFFSWVLLQLASESSHQSHVGKILLRFCRQLRAVR